MTISMKDIWEFINPYILQLVSVIITGIFAWIANNTTGWLKGAITQQTWDAIHSAVNNAAGEAIAKMEDGWATKSYTIDNPLIAKAATNAYLQIESLAKQAKLSPEWFANLVLSKVGLLSVQNVPQTAPAPVVAIPK